jgi:mRNA-degrading endonuclease toxin of MazEF toxin-antitoxin module
MQSSSLVKPLDVIDQGDMYWYEDTDAKGSEQRKDRLWVVMSRRSLNGNNTVVAVPLSPPSLKRRISIRRFAFESQHMNRSL